MPDVPHFALPFRFGPQAAVSEQDSIDEIADCALAIVLCPVGFRVELPTFGLPDSVFASPRVDVEAMRTAIDSWEPRAQTVLDERLDVLDELIAHVQVLVQLRTGE